MKIDTNDNDIHSPSSPISFKGQILENLEKDCSQSLCSTGKGDGFELAAKHFDRVLQISDDSDENMAIENEQKFPTLGGDSPIGYLTDSEQYHLFRGSFSNVESPVLKPYHNTQESIFIPLPRKFSLDDDMIDLTSSHRLKTVTPQITGMGLESKITSGNINDICEKLIAWDTSKSKLFKL